MNTQMHGSGWSDRRWTYALFGIAAFALAAWQLLLAPDATAAGFSHAGVLTAISIYAASHMLRVARLGVLLVFERPPTSRLFAIHFAAAWLSAVIPFKLGEAARAFGLVLLARRPATGIAAYLMEKILDAIVLLSAVAFLALTGDVSPAPGVLAAVLLIALALGAAAYLSARTALQELRTLVVTRSTSKRGLRLLYLLRSAEVAHRALRGMLRGRFVLLLCISTVIWALDLVAFTRIARAWGVSVMLPGDFLRALQLMLLPASGMAASAYYAAMVKTCLAIIALPASAVLLHMAMRPRTTPLTFNFFARHKRYEDKDI